MFSSRQELSLIGSRASAECQERLMPKFVRNILSPQLGMPMIVHRQLVIFESRCYITYYNGPIKGLAFNSLSRTYQVEKWLSYFADSICRACFCIIIYLLKERFNLKSWNFIVFCLFTCLLSLLWYVLPFLYHGWYWKCISTIASITLSPKNVLRNQESFPIELIVTLLPSPNGADWFHDTAKNRRMMWIPSYIFLWSFSSFIDWLQSDKINL